MPVLSHGKPPATRVDPWETTLGYLEAEGQDKYRKDRYLGDFAYTGTVAVAVCEGINE